jgi:hypothetical protein
MALLPREGPGAEILNDDLRPLGSVERESAA